MRETGWDNGKNTEKSNKDWHSFIPWGGIYLRKNPCLRTKKIVWSKWLKNCAVQQFQYEQQKFSQPKKTWTWTTKQASNATERRIFIDASITNHKGQYVHHLLKNYPLPNKIIEKAAICFFILKSQPAAHFLPIWKFPSKSKWISLWLGNGLVWRRRSKMNKFTNPVSWETFKKRPCGLCTS